VVDGFAVDGFVIDGFVIDVPGLRQSFSGSKAW
jgi:hypothetical protein